jgi:Dyp-type peroxidase family
MSTIDLNDIQGIVLRGYGKFPVSRFVLLQVTNPESARRWLGSIAPNIYSTAAVEDEQGTGDLDPVFNVAFTYEGFRTLGLREANMSGFSNEFREGMVTAHRQRVLGDRGEGDPAKWRWGGPNNDTLHAMLLLYAPDERSMEAFCQRHMQQFSSGGLKSVGQLDGLTLQGRKEHFGFRDGIGQPFVKGFDDGGPKPNRVALGEFVLGYENEYGLFPDSPTIVETQGDTNVLSATSTASQRMDFGRNGSYLIFRQLSQDVHGFWKFVREKTGRSDEADNAEAAIKLASQMVGRWPSGASLTPHPDADPGALFSDDQFDDFGYCDNDPNGERCPIGSHVRRTNPRDGLQDSSADQSTRIANHHRIIRRGRAYGKPPVESMNLTDLMKAPAPEHEVGLHFICFNANIANQFQFIQFNWAGSAKFERFYNDPDPLIGVRDDGAEGSTPVFSIPANPVRKSVTGLKRLVEVRGGAYLFMPGRRAIQFLASIQDNPTNLRR